MRTEVKERMDFLCKIANQSDLQLAVSLIVKDFSDAEFEVEDMYKYICDLVKEELGL